MKDTKIKLILGSHAHVPSGAGESEFEYVYENKMRPFITNLYRYSKIQAVLHYSGALLNWAERNHPEFIMLIEDMVSRKQAEVIGGGFYEPCFPLISQQDRISQIEFMTTYLRKHFGKRPQGCWLPSMVWEQNLVSSLCASDMSYTFLSQDQFLLTGMKKNETYTPCITEDQGKLIVVFPVSLSIEKELARKSFSQVFINLKKEFDKEIIFDNDAGGQYSDARYVCIFPEKISASETSAMHSAAQPPAQEAGDIVWNRFFEEISLSENYVVTMLPAKIIKSHKNLKKRSFPDSSAFMDSVSPRRFLIDNADVNGIYSKMIFTSMLINQLKGDKIRKLSAREELWKAQDSCFFTPGGGHLPADLRKTAYSSLIRAEKLTREKGKFTPSHIQYDFDFDAMKEFLFQDAHINCYVQPKGAGIFELDFLPIDWNYLDCGLSDSGRRTAFADALLPADAIIDCDQSDPNQTQPVVFNAETSRLCYNELYEPVTQDRKGKSCFKLPAGNSGIPYSGIEINKCYSLKKDVLSVSYTLKNTKSSAQDFIFIPEINLSFAGSCEDCVRFYFSDEQGKDTQPEKQKLTNSVKIVDVKNEAQIQISSTIAFSCCIAPIFDNSFYQASRILPVFKISLKNDESWSNSFSLKFSN